MAVQTFSLGGIVFDQSVFEVPEDFEYGLETWASIHNVPQTDGSPPKRIAQVWGVFPKAMKWDARFLGANAGTKLRALKNLQTNQAAVTLQMGRIAWDVIVKDVQVKERMRFDIGFTVEVWPLNERAGSASTATPPVGVGTGLRTAAAGLTSAATSAPTDPRCAATAAALTTANAAIAAAQPEQQQTTSALNALSSTVGSLTAAAQSLVTTLSTSAVASDAALYTWASGVLGFSQNYSLTLNGLIGTGAQVTVQANVGIDLFTIAATQLGDWSRFGDLASVNGGITDPFLTATIPALNIPRN